MTTFDDTHIPDADPVDPDLVAAEYVLGTLDPAERLAAAAKRLTDTSFDQAILAWEHRLAPLLDTVAEVAAPAHILPRLMQEVASRTSPVRLVSSTDRPATANVVAFDSNKATALRRRLRGWQVATALASGLAAALALGLGLVEAAHFGVLPNQIVQHLPATLAAYLQSARGAGTSFVAVLQKDAASPAFIVSVDLPTKSLTVRPVSPQNLPDKAYELWLVEASLGAPKSLGLIGDKPYTTAHDLPYAAGIVQTATYAVSVEPPGGSPTGAPTGPVVYAGKLIQTTP